MEAKEAVAVAAAAVRAAERAAETVAAIRPRPVARLVQMGRRLETEARREPPQSQDGPVARGSPEPAVRETSTGEPTNTD